MQERYQIKFRCHACGFSEVAPIPFSPGNDEGRISGSELATLELYAALKKCPDCGAPDFEKTIPEDIKGQLFAHSLTRYEDPEYTFSTFIVDQSNRKAVTALSAILVGEEQKSPLLLYGDNGCGRSHLVASLAKEYARQSSPEHVLWVSFDICRLFVRRCSRGSGIEQIPELESFFEGFELVVFEDIQGLTGKAVFQNIIHRIISSRLNSGNAHVVLTSVHPLSSLDFKNQELLDCVSSGTTVKIGEMNSNLRYKILSRMYKMRKDNYSTVTVPDDILRYMADHLRASGVVLGGRINALMGTAEATNKPVTIKLAKKIISGFEATE